LSSTWSSAVSSLVKAPRDQSPASAASRRRLSASRRLWSTFSSALLAASLSVNDTPSRLPIQSGCSLITRCCCRVLSDLHQNALSAGDPRRGGPPVVLVAVPGLCRGCRPQCWQRVVRPTGREAARRRCPGTPTHSRAAATPRIPTAGSPASGRSHSSWTEARQPLAEPGCVCPELAGRQRSETGRFVPGDRCRPPAARSQSPSRPTSARSYGREADASGGDRSGTWGELPGGCREGDVGVQVTRCGLLRSPDGPLESVPRLCPNMMEGRCAGPGCRCCDPCPASSVAQSEGLRNAWALPMSGSKPTLR